MGSDVFPLPFCGNGWIEDNKLADRALEIWCHITRYVNEIYMKPRSKIPVSNSLTPLKSAVQNGLIIAKKKVLVSLASIMCFRQMLHCCLASPLKLKQNPRLFLVTSQAQHLLQ